jgi:hypothetical protein
LDLLAVLFQALAVQAVLEYLQTALTLQLRLEVMAVQAVAVVVAQVQLAVPTLVALVVLAVF